MHEAAFAVMRLESERFPDPAGRFWRFSASLFVTQKEYFDVSVVNETRNQTYRRLAKLGAKYVGVDEEQMYKLLEVSDKPGQDGALNTGNQVTDDVRIETKMARVIGAHVTPTVFFNGVEEKSISSGWSGEQWMEWLKKNCS